MFIRLTLLAAGLLLSGCASTTFRPGETTVGDVEAQLGRPAMRWQEPDGSQQLAYPRGPAGFETYIAKFDAKGRLVSYANVLDTQYFAEIQPGMTMDQVQKIIGPPYEPWTVYFKARDELAKDWRFCDSWGYASRFSVLFDGTSKLVRSTIALREGTRRVPCSAVSVQIGGFGYRSP